MREASRGPGTLRPVDSEHSALWQCLGNDRFDPDRVKRLILTASGGPFRGWSADRLRNVTPADALNHPNWSMGNKITVDSATLMNKGLEIIEAHWLFECPLNAIDVIVHPESIIHSMVELHDGSVIAQLASHDMKVPIQYALTYPERINGPGETIDLIALGRLTFEAPDTDAFPLLRVAREAVLMGSTFPTVLSAADSLAVEAFLRGELPFSGIATVVEATLNEHIATGGPLTLEAIHEADTWTKRTVSEMLTTRAGEWT